MAAADHTLTKMLDPTYLASRDLQQVRKTWNPILQQKMSKHWGVIKEGIRDFSLAHAEMLKAVAQFERDETAELIMGDFLDKAFPGALELLNIISPFVNMYPNCATGNEVRMIDGSDTRSATVDPEPGSSRRPGSVGPPSRPAGLPTPVTPTEHKDGEASGAPGSSSIYDMPISPPPDTAHGPLTLQQTAKRRLETEATQTPRSPIKRAKKTQPPTPAKMTKKVGLWEVEGVEYIFKDKRFGPGWYVIRCNLGGQPNINPPGKFLKNPLEGNTALRHFNGRSHACHDTSREYTIDDIIREFAHCVTGYDITEETVNSANAKLKHLEQIKAKGSAKKQRKGK